MESGPILNGKGMGTVFQIKGKNIENLGKNVQNLNI